MENFWGNLFSVSSQKSCVVRSRPLHKIILGELLCNDFGGGCKVGICQYPKMGPKVGTTAKGGVLTCCNPLLHPKTHLLPTFGPTSGDWHKPMFDPYLSGVEYFFMKRALRQPWDSAEHDEAPCAPEHLVSRGRCGREIARLRRLAAVVAAIFLRF